MGNSKGFSFIELIIVVGLLGIVVGIVVPSVTNRMKLEGDINFKTELSRVANEAREDAISQNKNYHLAMDGDNKLVLKVEDENGNPGEPTTTVNIPATTSVKDTNVNGDSKENGDWDVRFFPDGSSDQAGISFTRNDISFALNIDDKGHGQVDDQLTDPSTTSWSAGTFESRN